MSETMRKGILAGLATGVGLIAACIGGLFIWVAVSTNEAAAAADKFLATLVIGDTASAYRSTASEFQAEQDERVFGMTFQSLGLSDYELAPWRDRSVERQGTSVIQGSLTENDLIDREFTVHMVREDGDWKVLSLFDPPRTGLGPGAWFRHVPPDEELERLTKESLLEFDRGVKAGDFADFFDTLALGFRLEITLSRIQTAYQHFIDDRIDLSGVADADLVLGELAVLERDKIGDILVVSGYYPIEPLPVPFTLRYRYEHPDWKLYRIFIEEPRADPLTPLQSDATPLRQP